MEFFGSAEVWTATGTWAMVLVLTVTLYFVYRQVRAANDLRRVQTRPYVVVSIDVEQQMLFTLTVENVGTTPAHEVHIEFDKPVLPSLASDDVQMLKRPIPMIPPGRTFRTAWDSSIRVLADDYPHPLVYRATVAYRGSDGHAYGPETYVLDFNMYRGQSSGRKGLPELVKAVEELKKEHHKWTDGIRGLRVHVVDAISKARRESRPVHVRRLKSAYKESGLKAAVLYIVDLVRRRYGLWSR